MNTIYYISAALDIFCVLISLVILAFLTTTEYKKTRLNRLFICIVVFSMVRYFCDTFTWLLIGNTASYSYIIHSAAEFLNYFFQYLLFGVYADYVITFIGKKAKVPRIIVHVLYGMCGIAIILLVISQFNHMYYYIDENNVYYRQKWFLLSQSFQFIGLFICIGIVVRYKGVFNRRELITLLTYFALPILGTIAQGAFYGLPSGNVSIMLATLIIYMGIQSEQAKLLKQQELELTNSRIDIMLSQIQPHFLYNALGAIDKLYFENTEEGHNAIVKFSNYLRGNMDSLTKKVRIPFAEELTHIKQYLSLEELRFGKKLQVIYDIQTDDFTLPVLSLQPIVENAVRYGVTKKPGGGSVTIKTEETEHSYIIDVTDDGAGFNPDEPLHDERSHIGIANVRERLRSMCGGSLIIHSTPGKGTTAVIEIPKGGTLR